MLDWDRWEAANRGTTKLNQRSEAGVAHRKAYQEKYRNERKKQLHIDAATRDGPRYDTKQCQTCSTFIAKQASVCPSCKVPATAKGAAAIKLGDNNDGQFGTSVSNAQAADALAQALLTIDSNRATQKTYVVAVIHGKRGHSSNAEYFVQWCGYPRKADWNWQRIGNLQNKQGGWTCPEAMAEFEKSQHKDKKSGK